MVVISPQIKFVEFQPGAGSALAIKEVFFHDCPLGISWNMTHLSPVNSRRVQSGALITQTIRYNKKDISLTMSFFDVTFKQYFVSLFEEGIRPTVKIWVENPTTFVEETEFNAICQILSLDEDTDQGGNARTITLSIAEA
jgi:hypothetical protein